MRVVFIGAAIAAGLSAALGPGGVARKALPPAADEVYEDDYPRPSGDLKEMLKVKDKRVNGVKLTIETYVDEGPKYRIGVRWFLDYDGPRGNLIILAPTLDRITYGQTTLFFFATGKSGKTYVWREESSVGNLGPLPVDAHKDWFASCPSIEGMRDYTDDIIVVPGDLRRVFRKRYPNEFDPGIAPPLYVIMLHCPKDRGEHLGLDAWTGQLPTAMSKINITEW